MDRHKFHGDVTRFEVLADYILDKYGRSIKYIADVAGGQGMLCRVLFKKGNYTCEVIDPRGWVLKGVEHQEKEFGPEMASYYDLIVGLHPDEAVRAVARAALLKPTILIPCCNFWSEEKLGQKELLQKIEDYYRLHAVSFERVVFPFKGPKNIGLVSEPPRNGHSMLLEQEDESAKKRRAVGEKKAAGAARWAKIRQIP